MAYTLTNQEVAEQFEAMAAALEILKKNLFRIRAYERAAASIRQTNQSLFQLWQEENLDSIPGLGDTFIGYLDELFRAGKVKHFQEILAKVPAAVPDLMKLEGVGPKTAQALAAEFDLPRGEAGYKKLKKVAQQGKIQNLPGFGEKSEQEILDALANVATDEKRLLLATALPIAEDVISFLKISPDVLEAASLGSLRRRAPTIGDIDIGVKTDNPDQVMEHLLKYTGIRQVLATGTKSTSFRHQTGLQVDVKTQSPDRWGSMLQHFTGSKQHNIHLRTLALQQGYSMSEYGLKTEQEESLAFEDEVNLYNQLGLIFIPPELREDKGEIAAAQKGKLPNLVDLKDIRGDLHLHCNLDIPTSHDRGASSVEELLDKALSLNYEYIAITDHNPPQRSLTSKERLEVTRQRRTQIQEAYLRWQDKQDRVVQLLIGYEVDITASGSLALEDEVLAEIDFAIASIHSSHKQLKDVMTERILTALDQPKVRILGHPTGRMLLSRSSVEADWPAIFEFCAKHKKFVEINASPDRLDLPAGLQRIAHKHNVKFAINTDTHHTTNMDLMRYGIWTARRGWTAKNDVLNTKNWTEVKQALTG